MADWLVVLLGLVVPALLIGGAVLAVMLSERVHVLIVPLTSVFAFVMSVVVTTAWRVTNGF